MLNSVKLCCRVGAFTACPSHNPDTDVLLGSPQVYWYVQHSHPNVCTFIDILSKFQQEPCKIDPEMPSKSAQARSRMTRKTHMGHMGGCGAGALGLGIAA